MFALLFSLAAAAPSPEWKVQRFVLDTGGIRGVSGMAIDPAGAMWAVAERDRALFRLRFDGGVPRLDGAPLRLEGVPGGVDTESLAWLGPGSIALGTEDQYERKREVVLTATVGKAGARVTGELEIPLKPWKIKGKPNAGVEGLCAAERHLLAIFETTREKKGRRLAGLAARTGEGKWVELKLVLTTDTGKISSLACRAIGPSSVEAIAIERHYAVSRVLRFIAILDGHKHTIEPEVLVDLAPLLDPMPNLEGIEWLDEKTLVLIGDDSHLWRAKTEIVTLTR